MRICIVGCGAVGSLFAANLATLDDVEVWAFDLSAAHVDAINAHGLRLTGAGEVHARLHATSDPAALPPCELGIVATKAMHAESAIAATAHVFADGAVASVMNGVGNEETLARHVERVIRGTTFPAGKVLEPGRRAVGRQGRHDVRAVRAADRRAQTRSSASPTPARGAGCRPTRSPTRAPRSGARSSSTRRRTRSARSPASRTAASASGPICARSSAASSTRARRSRPRRASTLDADPEA